MTAGNRTEQLHAGKHVQLNGLSVVQPGVGQQVGADNHALWSFVDMQHSGLIEQVHVLLADAQGIGQQYMHLLNEAAGVHVDEGPERVVIRADLLTKRHSGR